MENVAIGYAEPQDAVEIVELFVKSFRSEFTQLLIYGCKGASEYLQTQIASRSRKSGALFFVAKDANGHVIATTELQRLPDCLVLKYIAVHPDSCGYGLGVKLFTSAINILGMDSGHIAMDVFHENIKALNWCRRLGFTNGSSTVYLELIPPCTLECEPANTLDLSQSDAHQEHFGFSHLSVVTGNRMHEIKRFGSTWFLITDQDAVDKPEIFALLKQLDPKRRILAVVPAFSVPNAPVRRVMAKTYRMETMLEHLMPRLANQYEYVLKDF